MLRIQLKDLCVQRLQRVALALGEYYELTVILIVVLSFTLCLLEYVRSKRTEDGICTDSTSSYKAPDNKGIESQGSENRPGIGDLYNIPQNPFQWGWLVNVTCKW